MALQISLHYPMLSILYAGLWATGHLHMPPACHFSTRVFTVHLDSHLGPKSSFHSL